ncbi:zinc ABC transporter substrate-binding protein [Curtobacterium flaccumfaciens pv. flaccumfaciens]|uniref:metal ABC transporter solute-binding protein, Zn/Mn family n=1 Tax=Curtobacterium flaccumfaciens TaxID=2035 RepID=UPI001ADACA24|nr:zinc ABC transporter substrate-binding protein [Curtobacterium flaccumfaciens]MBO9045630.1 zinc ABC transporter substrate-binding protein [Curtobacterium flaccumfaciens pv. flaccumfaciens]QTR91184.1 zinc ABC transporter substrate-binding protein [Curtobacterium flaccumfaciens pv. flaccumfaciens]QVG66497.1 zinc ABC transporter substrate-binding protein [Curtobacterium flaccumfaciens pv. flaccumfaciens]
MHNRLLALPLVAGTAALALTGCATSSASGEASSSDGTINVVASTNVYGSIVKTIGGDAVTVTSILSDPSQDPHSFESSARTQLSVSKADLLIENGGGYDDFMTTLANASDTKADTINVVKLSGLDKGGSAEFNEHVFYSYPTMVKLVEAVTKDLSALDESGKDAFEKNAATLTTKLEDLESQTDAVKKQDSGDKVAYTEPVPGYLFDAMGLENETPPEFSEAIEEGDDVPPAALRDTLALFTGKRVQLLAYNNQASSPETEQVQKAAEQNDIPVVGVTETLPKGQDYVSWQQANIDAVKAALQK